MTKKDVIEALNKLYSDTSVPQETTLEALEEILEELQSMIETLQE